METAIIFALLFVAVLSAIIALFLFFGMLIFDGDWSKASKVTQFTTAGFAVLSAVSIWGLVQVASASPEEIAAAKARDAEIVRLIEEQGFTFENNKFEYTEGAPNYVIVSLDGNCELAVRLRYELGAVTLTRTNDEGVTVNVTPDKLARWCNL